MQVHGEKVERVLRLLALVLDHAHGRNQPLYRPHHASARGTPFALKLLPSIASASEWESSGPFEVVRGSGESKHIEIATHTEVVRSPGLPAVLCPQRFLARHTLGVRGGLRGFLLRSGGPWVQTEVKRSAAGPRSLGCTGSFSAT